jgi:hypothetical protein
MTESKDGKPILTEAEYWLIYKVLEDRMSGNEPPKEILVQATAIWTAKMDQILAARVDD